MGPGQVQQNIAAFGGDRKRVFLFGESAGAGSVAAHTVMPKSINRGLFSRAGMESGGYSVWDAHGLNTSQQTFDKLAGLLCPAASNTTLLACLREKDTATVSLMAQLLPKPCDGEFCCKWGLFPRCYVSGFPTAMLGGVFTCFDVTLPVHR
eukprot:SAG11_NODE_949_length_6408_cov_16.986210_3_plen_151_part_00